MSLKARVERFRKQPPLPKEERQPTIKVPPSRLPVPSNSLMAVKPPQIVQKDAAKSLEEKLMLVRQKRFQTALPMQLEEEAAEDDKMPALKNVLDRLQMEADQVLHVRLAAVPAIFKILFIN